MPLLSGDRAYIKGVQDTVAAIVDYASHDLIGQLLSVPDSHAKGASPEMYRDELVEKLLAGGSPDSDEIAALNYRLTWWHIGMVIVGEDSFRLVRDLAARLNCQLLTVSQADETLWVWLGGKQKLTGATIEKYISQPTNDVTGVIGEPGVGFDGWLLTHREAKAAIRVALLGPARIVRCIDVLLEAAMLGDEALLDRLMMTYLRPLDSFRDGGRAVRATLRVYFRTRCNVAETAARMGIADRTVRERLSKASTRLGYAVTERHAELEIALRMENFAKGVADT